MIGHRLFFIKHCNCKLREAVKTLLGQLISLVVVLEEISRGSVNMMKESDLFLLQKQHETSSNQYRNFEFAQ